VLRHFDKATGDAHGGLKAGAGEGVGRSRGGSGRAGTGDGRQRAASRVDVPGGCVKLSTGFSSWGVLLFGIALIVANAALFYKSLNALLSVEGDIRHTMRAEQMIGQVLSSLLDAETGQRGFLITDDHAYLAPYYRALAEISGNLVALGEVVATSDEQRRQLDRLKVAVDDKLQELAASIAIHNREGRDASAAFVGSNRGIARMDTIRTVLQSMSEAEEKSLAERQQDYGTQVQITFGTMLFLVATSIALFATLVVMVRRQVHRHAAAVEQHSRYAGELALSVEALERERNRIAEINEMSSLLQSCNSVSELGDVVRGTLGNLFRDAGGSLYLFAPARNRLVLLAECGDAAAPEVVSPEDCWGLRRGGSHRFHEGARAPACAHTRAEGPPAAALCIPLTAHGETMGLLTFRAFTSASDGVAGTILSPNAGRYADMAARHLALAIANLQLRETLKEQSIRDPLTGAFNRRYLEVVGEKEIAQSLRFGRSFAVVMLDVDHFKRFNDIHGHAAGDLVLVTVSDYLRRHTRDGDWLFRYGGEEFVLLLREMEGAEAEAKGEALREGIASLTVANGGTALPSVTVSMGIAVLAGEVERLASVLERADEALYASKRRGRNRVTLHDDDRARPIDPG
jgi:diguanylate cyclase (GGDEF)-like protein